MTDTIAYLENGEPVRILARWRAGALPLPQVLVALLGNAPNWGTKTAPRNVLIELSDGTRVVRQADGLRVVLG